MSQRWRAELTNMATSSLSWVDVYWKPQLYLLHTLVHSQFPARAEIWLLHWVRFPKLCGHLASSSQIQWPHFAHLWHLPCIPRISRQRSAFMTFLPSVSMFLSLSWWAAFLPGPALQVRLTALKFYSIINLSSRPSFPTFNFVWHLKHSSKSRMH